MSSPWPGLALFGVSVITLVVPSCTTNVIESGAAGSAPAAGKSGDSSLAGSESVTGGKDLADNEAFCPGPTRFITCSVYCGGTPEHCTKYGTSTNWYCCDP